MHRFTRPEYSKLSSVVLPYAFALVTLGSLFLHAQLNIRDFDFWLDESAQYWMAMGQNYLSPLGSPSAPFTLENAASGNLDPPGFGLMLRLWIEVFGDSTVALRFLPLVLMTGFWALIGLIGREFSLPFPVGASIGLLFVSFSIAKQYSTELRAYSAEMFVIALSIWALIIWLRKSTLKQAVFLAGALVFGLMFSRYSFAFAVVAIAIIVLARLFPLNRKGAIQLALFAGVGLITALALGWFAFFLVPGRPHSTPDYVQGLLLSNSGSVSDVVDRFAVNLASPLGLPVSLLIATWVGMEVVWRWKPSLRSALDSLKPSFRAMGQFALLYTFFSVALSALGLHPWSIDARWSIGLVALSAVSASVLAGLVWRTGVIESMVSSFGFVSKSTRRLVRGMRAVVVAALFLLVGLAGWNFAQYKHLTYEGLTSRDNGYLEVYQVVDENRGPNVTWFVERRLWPSFRMTVERALPPESLVFDAQQIPDFDFNDDNLSAFLQASLRCPDSGSDFYLLRQLIRESPGSEHILTSFGNESPCDVVVFPKIDRGTMLMISRSSEAIP